MADATPGAIYIVIERADGTVAIMQYLTIIRRSPKNIHDSVLMEQFGTMPRPSEDADIQREVDKTALAWGAGEQPISWRRADRSELIEDRTFRDAWEAHPQQKVRVNMDRARNIQRDRFRVVRKAKLEQLDIDYTRADARGDSVAKQAIENKRQAWRDVTKIPELDKAATPEELKAVTIPAELLDS